MTTAYIYARISSKKQIDGDGLRRQVEAAEKYAKDNNFDVDDTLYDIASGFHQKHVSGGALGAFLELVKSGKIQPGSVLIVEALDRLSRANVLVAQNQLFSLLLSGVDVVTLEDNFRYSRDNDSLNQFYNSPHKMARGYDESNIKSLRGKAYLAQLHEDVKAGRKARVHHLPSWLEQTQIGTSKEYEFTLRESVSTVQKIFELYEKGYGIAKIAIWLNENGILTLQESRRSNPDPNKIWRRKVVGEILNSVAVRGDLAIGDTVVEGYYPAAVDPVTWWRVNDRYNNKSKKATNGRTGLGYTNLFAGISKCFHCGGPARVIGGGSGHRYITCEKIKETGELCTGKGKYGKTSLRYDILEKAVLDNVATYCHLPEIPTVSSDDLKRQVIEIQTGIADIDRRISNIIAMAEITDHPDDKTDLMTRLKALRSDKSRQTAEIERVTSEIRTLETVRDDFTTIHKTIEDERTKWDTLSGDDLFQSRSLVNSKLREIVSVVSIDAVDQSAYVSVAGATRIWEINAKGEVTRSTDFSDLSEDALVKMASGVGLKADRNAIQRVKQI
ncbi:recombinase family protein [Agrobacterium tumefaciens]|uniref:Recombinase family protein n=1 Tax=Agrobacterium tumefaciens TaxID=358 RepID=A0AA44F8M7_AGRTU|nr:recombinase family protein [Agrobacterium tumefaciens]NTB86831.1 recombinase family protein [Agrobacterium tumefaciens]NTC21160.1 recombinase family protein [Agrobacterium tumefaciens]NTC30708.1 recombinase family protein [Agrobacterium tumefaciens]